MKTYVVAALALFLAPLHSASGQTVTYIDTDSAFRVTYVRFDLTVPQIDTEYIEGSVTLRCVSRGLRPDRRIELRFRDILPVDSIRSGPDSASCIHTADTLYVTLPKPHPAGDVFDVTVSYHGYSRGSFVHAYHIWPPTGEVSPPIIWTSAEPFGAMLWWPVKENPAEKIDSADILVTCSGSCIVAANGILRSVTA